MRLIRGVSDVKTRPQSTSRGADGVSRRHLLGNCRISRRRADFFRLLVFRPEGSCCDAAANKNERTKEKKLKNEKFRAQSENDAKHPASSCDRKKTLHLRKLPGMVDTEVNESASTSAMSFSTKAAPTAFHQRQRGDFSHLINWRYGPAAG
jgi:hypothetical protein